MASSMVLKFCARIGRPAVSTCTVMASRHALVVRHDPTLKRKRTHKIDPKKRPKKTSNISKKPVEVFPPVDPEAFVDRTLLQPDRLRQLPKISEKEKERRVLLLKDWSKYRNRQQRDELRRLQDVIMSRELALRELRKISPWHYEQAVKADEGLFPLQLSGPTETPPIAGYVAPDAID